MADFLKAYNITLDHEGGYSNDPTDIGRETYKGISRKYNPDWDGWVLIDSLKSDSNFPNNTYKNTILNDMICKFYKEKYWDVILLDECTSQEVANELFDTSVNMGTTRAIKFLQRALNLLNKDGNIYSDISEDGKMGKNTLKALKACIDYRGDSYLFKILNLLQGNHYLEFMIKNPEQEKFAYGWLSRVTFTKQ